jgi:hypothetical protein
MDRPQRVTRERTQTDWERQRARIVWESLERAADHLTPGHPAELHIRRALAASEAHWRTLTSDRRDEE